jgi:hypothetical protein
METVMQARSASNQRQPVCRAIERAAFFADKAGPSFSPMMLYEELDGYAKIAYDAQPSKHWKLSKHCSNKRRFAIAIPSLRLEQSL